MRLRCLVALTERSKNMISAYLVIPLVFGIVLSYLWLIHRLWLRSVFRQDPKPTVDAKIAGDVGNLRGSNLEWPGKILPARSIVAQ